MREAYRAAVSEAQYEYGHDPYSGTIATCRLTKTVTPPNGEVTDEWLESLWDRVPKWEVYGFQIKEGKYGFVGWAAC